jgi:hypothetical protein
MFKDTRVTIVVSHAPRGHVRPIFGGEDTNVRDPNGRLSGALYFGPFNTAQSLGIDRGNYIAIQSTNSAAAAQYAVENMVATVFLKALGQP